MDIKNMEKEKELEQFRFEKRKELLELEFNNRMTLLRQEVADKEYIERLRAKLIIEGRKGKMHFKEKDIE